MARGKRIRTIEQKQLVGATLASGSSVAQVECPPKRFGRVAGIRQLQFSYALIFIHALNVSELFDNSNAEPSRKELNHVKSLQRKPYALLSH